MSLSQPLLFLFFVTLISAQPYILFGLDAWSVPIKIDTANFSTTQLSSTSVTFSKFQQSAVYIPSANQFYIVTYDAQTTSFYLIGISTSNGNQVPQPLPFNQAATTYQLILDYSHTSGELYITGPCNDSANAQCMISMDPINTGSWQDVSRIAIPNTQNVALSAFDEMQNVEFVLLGAPTLPVLVGISASDGSLVYKMPLKGISMSTLHFDRTTGLLYGIGKKGNGGAQLLQIDAKRNTISTVTTLSGYGITLGSTSAVNYDDGVFFLPSCPIPL